MIQTELSLFLLLVFGGLGSVAGYLLRIVTKFEERKDEISLKFLPALNYNTYFFRESVDFFLDDTQLSSFKDKIGTIGDDLTKQVFSGDILFLDPNLRETISSFYRKLKKFQSVLEQLNDTTENARMLKLAFEEQRSFMDINLKDILDDAKKINDAVESKLNKYKSFSYYLLMLIFILGAAIAAIGYFKT